MKFCNICDKSFSSSFDDSICFTCGEEQSKGLKMKTNNYASSITSKYGDIDNVKTDVKTLRDIHSRQGSSLLIDVISELAGEVSNEMNLSNEDRLRLITNLVNELKESLLERL